MHSFPLKRRLQEKLTDPRGKNKLMGASLHTRVLILLLPSLDMQPGAYPRVASCSSLRSLQRVRWAPLRCKLLLHENATMCPTSRHKFTGVDVCSPRPAGHGEFCKYLPDSLTGGVGTRDRWTVARTGPGPLCPRNGRPHPSFPGVT